MLPVPTYLTNPRHLGFDSGLYDSAAEYRGWGELGVHHPVSHPGPGGPSLPVTSWAGTPTSPPLAHTGGVEDRGQEDSKSGLLSQWDSSSSYEADLQRWREMVALGGEAWSPYLPNTTESKMSMESPSGYPALARPQSATSLSPPSHLAAPQPINPRLPNNMLALNGGVRKYQCKMCPQAFHSKADLQLHTQIHLREPKPYKCASCGKAFANSSYLSQHTRIHLGIKPYRCEICQRKFTQLSHLQQHIRTHTGDKPYKCRIPGCTKAFSQLSNLQSHSRCHQSDKPYKCNSCYKCFTDEPALLEHIPKHRDSKHVKTHICAYCGKSYTQETYLAKHMQKHADRVDKRPPITAGPGHSGMGGLGEPYWPKMDPMAAMYGYQPGLAEHRLELERDQGYTVAGWDPRNSSAFSALQPPVTSVHSAITGHKTSYDLTKPSQSYDLTKPSQSYDLTKPSQSYDLPKPSQSYDLTKPSQSYDLPKPSQSYDLPKPSQSYDSAQFLAKPPVQHTSVQQESKASLISLASIQNYTSDKPGLGQVKKQQ